MKLSAEHYRLREVREGLGLTQTEFGKILGLKSSTADIERGKTRITGRIVMLLFKNWNINPVWLYGDTDKKYSVQQTTDVLPKAITVDKDGSENILLVNEKASAGYGANIGEHLCSHPDVDMLSFTGSTGAGIKVAQAASTTVKRVCQELGGKSPFIITEDADLAAAVRYGVEDVMINSGQTCCALTRMLVPESLYQQAIVIAKAVAEEFNIEAFATIEALIEKVDVVDIVTPTLSHFDCAKQAIENGCHIFIEKPITKTVLEAETIKSLAKENNVKGQVGHVERFNPSFTAVKDKIDSPMFIETHRLAEFNPRGTDVPVVLDLMIHDIDIILSVVNSDVKNVHASGVSVISETPDIANARIEFENGCVANLTASRISMKNMRKSRFFQKDAYISVDFLGKVSEVVRMKEVPEKPDEFAMILQNAEGVKKQIYFDNPEVEANNAILDELESFANAIETGTKPVVSLNAGTEALRVAQMVIDCF